MNVFIYIYKSNKIIIYNSSFFDKLQFAWLTNTLISDEHDVGKLLVCGSNQSRGSVLGTQERNKFLFYPIKDKSDGIFKWFLKKKIKEIIHVYSQKKRTKRKGPIFNITFSSRYNLQ
jgi:hypothetical protein